VLKRWTLASLPITLLLAACSGGSGGSSALTTTAAPSSPTAAVTVAPTRAPVPNRPVALRDYAPAVARYLTSDRAAADDCLSALYAAWKMPRLAPGAGCTLANTDEDPAKEVVAVFTAASATSGAVAAVEFDVVIFHRAADGYHVTYESGVQEVSPPGTQTFSPVLAAGDLIGDGGGELAYTTESCGASTCSTTVHVVRGTASGYVSLTPPDGITMASADVKVQDADGKGSKEIVLTGGEQGSVGAGPQRQQTQVWAWNGTAYALKSTTPAPPVFLYHAVKDADALFAAGKYSDAEAAYLATVGNNDLKVWNPDGNERNELEAYALFRAALAELMSGGDRAKANGYLARGNAYTGTLNRQLAGAFEAGFAAKGEVSVGCSAVREDVQANVAEYTQFWDFGYGNPPFDPNTVCPF
jgi:hypothetical protein